MTPLKKLIVEVVEARELSPKDGHGSSSPYVVIDFNGQRKRTKTAVRDLNPSWNEVLEFDAGETSEVLGDVLELEVLHDLKYGPTTRSLFLGRIQLSSTQFVKKGEEALIHYKLEKKSLFSWIHGEIGLRVYFADVPIAPQISAPKENPKPDNAPAVLPENAPPVPPENAPPVPPEPDSKAKEDVAENGGKAEASSPESEQPHPPEGEGEKLAQEETNPEVDGPPGNSGEEPPPPPPPHPSNPPPVEVMPAMISRSASEVKVQPIGAPQPISRSSSAAASFTSDPPEMVPIERSSFDLVEKMHYIFVKVVKARSLPTNRGPVVKIAVAGIQVTSKPARRGSALFEWEQTFAFGRDAPDSSSILEVSVWDPKKVDAAYDVVGHSFLGGICFDITEIPLRDPPDSPLAPQWYRLEGGGAHRGDLMLATWIGTQADESFPEAWKTDTAGNVNSKSKVYLSPKLWYLRATVVEAQDVLQLTASKEASFQVRAQLGFQVLKTKPSVARNGSPTWNEDFLFVAAEPFTDNLVFSLEYRQPKGPVTLGLSRIPLTAIERRVDDRNVVSRWFSFDDKGTYKGRVHLKLCFDGGYHVMDEAAHVCSDFRPTARQLWKPPVGMVELGLIGCRTLLPMKTVNGKGTTDAYAVAKYGPKWVRTRTVSDNFDPKWNEQYTWKVYDPCTVLTIGVFDSCEIFEMDGQKEPTRPDCRIGKVRIRISTLEMGKVYRNTYPLFVFSQTGLTKMGEIELAVRFLRTAPTLDLLHVYTQPLLPLMHHIRPLGGVQQEMLRNTAAKIVAAHLSRSEPPLRREVVLWLLDADSHFFSMRKVRANWYRIINVIAGALDVVQWVEATRSWKKPTSTVLVHALLVLLVWYPDLIIPTLAFYVFAVGAWNYRFRSRDPLPHVDPRISLTEVVDREELDEEFDGVPSSRSPEIVRARYDKVRAIGAKVQVALGEVATQGERVHALVTWRDPRATGMFIGLCLVVALVLYLVPSKMVAMALGFYYLRHPIFRDRMPAPALNFFRRLPSLSDRIM